jgi:hypothetical protein
MPACILALPELSNSFRRLTSYSRSASSANNSTAPKNLTAFGFGLPKNMRSDLLPHPCSGRVRDVPVPDSERELKPLKISLKIFTKTRIKACIYKHVIWKRGYESIDSFTD